MPIIQRQLADVLSPLLVLKEQGAHKMRFEEEKKRGKKICSFIIMQILINGIRQASVNLGIETPQELKIVDARPKAAALGNKAMGAG